MTVAAQQRYMAAHPCPICGGRAGLPQGQGQRCWGFLSADGKFARCTREEHAGNLRCEPDGTYPHRLHGDCRCGIQHDGSTPERRLTAIDVLHDKGITQTTLDAFGVRPDSKGWGGVEIPVRDEHGDEVAVRLRTAANKKLWPRTDEDSRRFPVLADWSRIREQGWCLLTAGEADFLVAWQAGLPAATFLHGEGAVKPEAVALLAQQGIERVDVTYDIDEAGRRGVERLRQPFQERGVQVRVLRLPVESPGKDLCDLYAQLGHDDDALRQAIEDADEVPQPVPPTLPFRTAAQLASMTPERPEWIVEGLLAAGSTTELSGKVKSGKTTMMMAMAKAFTQGKPFLGFSTTRSRVLYLTEERPATVRAVLDRVGLARSADLEVLHLTDVLAVPWAELVPRVVQHAHDTGARVLMVDTLSRWARIVDENDAHQAAKAMEPLEKATAEGLAVFAGRHDRKSGGEIGDSARGSSAFSGAADILLTLKKANTEGHPNRRIIEGVGRYDGTPDMLITEWRDGEFVNLGNARDVEHREVRRLVLDVLPGPDAEPVLLDDLMKRAGKASRSTTQRSLDELVSEGMVEKVRGLGKTHRANGYRLAPGPENEPPSKGRGAERLDSPTDSVNLITQGAAYRGQQPSIGSDDSDAEWGEL